MESFNQKFYSLPQTKSFLEGGRIKEAEDQNEFCRTLGSRLDCYYSLSEGEKRKALI